MKTSLLLFLGAHAAAAASTAGYRLSNNGTRDWDAAVQLAQGLISQLTLDEKVMMITGNSSAGYCIGNIAPVPRLNFTGICMLDGPNDVNRADLVSVFPSGITAAATWDRELIYLRGYALGEEFKGKGADVALGPTTGPMGRHALGGRNWEGFGPDPYLAGVSTAESVLGLQDAGVQTSTKHFIGNEQETQRSSTTSPDGTRTEAISSNIDDRTIHELYMWPFASAVKAGTSSIMCSYNRLNQEYTCQNSYLLQKLLREELGFKGYVVSDWFATHSTAKSINSGLDLEMPGYLPTNYPGSELWFGENVLNAIRNGSVTEDRVDEMIRNILTPYYYLEQDAADYPSPDDSFPYLLLIQEASLEFGREVGLIPDDPNFVFPRGRDVRGDHAKLIREMGAAGTVLLKNNNTLPLKTPKVIGVFGNDAGDFTNGFYRPSETPESVNTGTMVIGGGSGTGRPSYVVSPLDAIKSKAKEIEAQVLYVTHNEVIAKSDFRGIYPPPELCLVFQQTFASESFDRTSFELDGNSTAVINNVADFCGNTVVVTHSGGVNTMPWASHPKIGAILAAHYPGQESGNSIVDLLWGDVAPSGRLPYTIPRSAEDAGPAIVNLTQPVADPLGWQANFSEGLLIDYRHYDAQGIEPLYEFGFGLTYTTFAIDTQGTSVALAGGAVADRPNANSTVQPGGHPELWEDVVVVKTSVTNTGDRAAHAVPQLYLSFPGGAPEGTPVKVLRGFEKVFVEAGASADVEFRLQRRDVSYWDTDGQAWVIPSGEFVFLVGFSSRDLPVEKSFAVLATGGALEGVDNRFVVN
ncbi:beta-glucosidase [Diaporthe sp. PMI_573]|nr:beta-glucosidase [Diaporthaceae sp. PMI_573]